MTQTVDTAGLVTSYSYADGGRKAVQTLPGGATQVTTNFLDGRVKSVTGSGTVHQYYWHEPETNGTQWSATYTGPDGTNSPLWRKTVVDMTGRTVIEERPAYGGGTVSNVYFYDVLGLLARSRQPGMATNLYDYDALRSLMRSGLDIDGDGTLDLSGPDRITETTNHYFADVATVYRFTESRVYPFSGSSQSVRDQSGSVQLSGLTTNMTMVNVAFDVYGNATVSRTLRHRAERVVTNVMQYPDSVTNGISVAFNGLQRLARTRTGVETSYSHDALGRQTAVTDPRTGTTVTHYDSRGWMDYVEDPLGDRTSYGYDPDTGRRIAVTNALGKVARYLYDDRGQLVFAWGDVPYPVKYTYDDYGRMSEMYTYRAGTNWSSTLWPTNSAGDSDGTFWQYDLATGLLTNKLYADGNGTLYTYAPEGKLLTRKWARQVSGSDLVTTYTYDGLTAELTNINYSALTTNVSYGFDRMGRYTQIVDAAGTRAFDYSDKLQLTNETITGLYSREVTRNYEPAGGEVPGRGAGFQMGDEYYIWYAYDGVGRFNGLLWTNAGETECHAAYAYLPKSYLIESRSGWSVPGLTNVETRTYEAKRDLVTEVLNRVHTNTISRYEYVNDALGRRTAVLNDGLAFASVTNAYTRYGYNTRSELTGARRYLGTNVYCAYQPVSSESFTYEYDNAGNRDEDIEAIVRVKGNQLNQSVIDVVPQYQYDADGNLTNDGVFAYGWNGANRLMSVEPLEATGDSSRVDFLYDYMGRRVQKVVSAWNGSAWEVARTNLFIYDGWNLAEELVLTNSVVVTNQYVWGLDLSGTLQGAGGIGGLLSRVRYDDGGTNVLMYCFDANGNVGQLVGTNGSLAARYEYAPYGALLVEAGLASTNNHFRFSTKYQDAETELYYYGYRFYSPETGRWPSRDPIGELGRLNLYGFVQNNPIGNIDPLGLACSWAVGLCTRNIMGVNVPSTWTIRGITITVPQWVRNLVNAVVPDHHDVKAVACNQGCTSGACDGGEVEEEIIKGFFADSFTDAIGFYISWVLRPDLTDGYVLGRVKDPTTEPPGPGLCNLSCVSEDRFDKVKQNITTSTANRFHLTRFNCQDWAAAQLAP